MEKIHRHQAGQIAVEGIVHRICLASCLGSQCLYGTQAAGSSRRREEIHGASHLGVVLVWVFFFFLIMSSHCPVLARAAREARVGPATGAAGGTKTRDGNRGCLSQPLPKGHCSGRDVMRTGIRVILRDYSVSRCGDGS